MFTKNIGIIFFILYLKATILEMSSQLNNVQNNNVQNNNIIDNSVEDVPKIFRDNYTKIINVENGTYETLFDTLDTCYLMQNNEIKYKLEDYYSGKILKSIRKLKIKKTKETMNDLLFYNFKYNVTINKDNYKLSIKHDETNIIKDEEIKITLSENSEYKVKSYDINKNMVICNDVPYKVQPSMIKALNSYINESHGILYCSYAVKEDNKEDNQEDEDNDKECEVTIVTGKYNQQYECFDFNLKIKIGDIETTIYNHKIDSIDYKTKGLYLFTHFYINKSILIGYDFRSKNYYYIEKNKFKTYVLPYLDEDFRKQYMSEEIEDEYIHMINDDNGKYYCLKLEIKEGKKGKMFTTYKATPLMDNFFKCTLDITKIESYKVDDEQDNNEEEEGIDLSNY